MKNIKKNRKKWFTMIEVIISLSIFTIITLILAHNNNIWFYSNKVIESNLDNHCFLFNSNKIVVYEKWEWDLKCSDTIIYNELYSWNIKMLEWLEQNKKYVEYAWFVYDTTNNKFIK